METDELFQIFQKLLLEKTGIFLRKDEKWPLLTNAFPKQGLEMLVTSKAIDNKTWSRIFQILNISETYFYRDPNQLTAIFESILPFHWNTDLLSPVSVWSAGCSKGEEAYTLAILLELFRKRHNSNWDFKIVGTDIQEESIQFAKKGIYSHYSIRSPLPPGFKEYLQIRESEITVPETLRSKISFRVGNLLEPSAEKFNLIVCRNVLIYLDQKAKETIVGHFWNSLREGGILVLGHSEYMGEFPPFVVQKTIAHQTSYYVINRSLSAQRASPKDLPGPKTSQMVVNPPPKKENLQSRNPDGKSISNLPKNRANSSKGEEIIPSREAARKEKNKGNFEEMAMHYISAIYENPQEIEAYYELATYHWERGNRAEARKYQAQAKLAFKNNPALAETLKKKGDWLEVWEEFLLFEL